MNYPKFKVCVRCFTFNQSKYIIDAMNGFTMQQTDFPFVCCIVDDASTDNEQEVIRKYMEENLDFSEEGIAYHEVTDYAHITYAQHKSNKNCYFAVLYLKENHYSQRKDKMQYLAEWRALCEYEALCEGDDYWIASDKLQKQVMFLDNSPQYAMCYSSAKYFYQEKKKFAVKSFGGPSESFEDLMRENTIPTPTVLLRIECEKNYYKEIGNEKRNWLMGDYPMWLYYAKKYKVKYLRDESFSVYRVLEESASHQKDGGKQEAFIKSTVEIQEFFAKYFNTPELLEYQKLEKYLFNNAVLYGNRERARDLFKRIDTPSFNMKLKYVIIRNHFLYRLFKGRLFYSLDN